MASTRWQALALPYGSQALNEQALVRSHQRQNLDINSTYGLGVT
ncbi:MAG: hypothetical protein WA939_05690 [Nodosilinea sp.]